MAKQTFSTASMMKDYLFCGSANTNLKWLLGDHLGSTSVTADYAGTLISRTLYKPLHSIQGRLWGEVRYQSGALPTQYTYTGQYSHTADFGLMYYVARWYDPYLNRFIQPDTIVPDQYNPIDWDKYAYTRNNPLRFTDSSGHCIDGLTTIICAAVIGAVISVAVDAYVTTQVNHEEYTLEQFAVAATIGAASGAIGAGIIAPIASAVGAGVGAVASSLWAVPTASVAAIQTSTTLAVGATLSAASNVGLSTTQDVLNQMGTGEGVTLQTFEDSVSANWTTDAFYGAAGYVAGYGIGGAIDDFFWQPSITVAPLLNTNPGQKLTIGVLQAGSQAISNSTLLEAVINPVMDKLTPGVAQ